MNTQTIALHSGGNVTYDNGVATVGNIISMDKRARIRKIGINFHADTTGTRTCTPRIRDGSGNLLKTGTGKSVGAGGGWVDLDIDYTLEAATDYTIEVLCSDPLPSGDNAFRYTAAAVQHTHTGGPLTLTWKKGGATPADQWVGNSGDQEHEFRVTVDLGGTYQMMV